MSRPRRLGVVALALVAAVAAFLIARPGEDEPQRAATAPADTAAETSTAREEAKPAPARPRYTRIRIEDGRPVGGARTIDVRKGQRARLEFRADDAGEAHIHGYDRVVALKAGRAARVAFPAELEGVFEVELHGPGTELASLRVSP